jgi:Arc/MetJ family transcription regulator
MTMTQIDLDDEALAEVVRLSGARSTEEAVNLALREYVRHWRKALLVHDAGLARGLNSEAR